MRVISGAKTKIFSQNDFTNQFFELYLNSGTVINQKQKTRTNNMISSKAQNLLNLLDECEQEYEQLLENQRNEFLKTKESLSQFFKKSEEIQSTLGSQEEKIAKKRIQKTTAEKPQSAPRKKRDGISLKEAILEVLGRSENKDGLTSKAIAEIIDSEKIWQTNGALGTQVGTNLHTLKNSGKVAREGKLYMIP